ncbi:hypothetical protein N7478_012906 [Penicillium angulare]|uniref:uncharacterized protein n=1 Tax=Penicillium angulare TaxID=116970 RepID=UPI00253F7EF7|nr:uncharacterized protein N7478_012906 [Penicillium angulare]KAJ5256802.1 hypothetical protein N7478_012906 [Penicillium angulare]
MTHSGGLRARSVETPRDVMMFTMPGIGYSIGDTERGPELYSSLSSYVFGLLYESDVKWFMCMV